VFGLSKSVTLAIVGWLWADILLGLFVIFLAAASPPVKLTPQAGPSIDPTPITLDIDVDGSRMLGTNVAAAEAEQTRFADAVKQQLLAKPEGRKVALVFAYGWNQDAALGQALAVKATDALPLIGPQFQGAVLKSLHDIHPGDPGTKVSLEIYVYR
jgi:hypothetical protein